MRARPAPGARPRPAARSLARAASDPAVPLALLGAAAPLAVLWRPGPLWLVLGAIAGYSLSGSV